MKRMVSPTRPHGYFSRLCLLNYRPSAQPRPTQPFLFWFPIGYIEQILTLCPQTPHRYITHTHHGVCLSRTCTVGRSVGVINLKIFESRLRDILLLCFQNELHSNPVLPFHELTYISTQGIFESMIFPFPFGEIVLCIVPWKASGYAQPTVSFITKLPRCTVHTGPPPWPIPRSVWAIHFKSWTWIKAFSLRISFLNYLLGWPRPQ